MGLTNSLASTKMIGEIIYVLQIYIVFPKYLGNTQFSFPAFSYQTKNYSNYQNQSNQYKNKPSNQIKIIKITQTLEIKIDHPTEIK
jgi:hypothetical protein